MMTLKDWYRMAAPSMRRLLRESQAQSRKRAKVWDSVKPGQRVRILMGGKSHTPKDKIEP
jgi:hypothetical protein